MSGHARVYHGSLAELGKKHVSRQRLCLPGMMEYRVNSAGGMPFFFITAEVNERMIEMLESEIIPRLLEFHPVGEEQRERMVNNPEHPLFTLVFDREGYSPAFFKRLWEKYRVAVITYRKNVKDTWDEALFEEQEVEASPGSAAMKLHGKETVLDGYPMREARKLAGDNHQTSIITVAQIASYMFGRWVQENFFRHMRQEYSMDKIIQYGIDQVDDNLKEVNREYSNITCRIKKEREKLARRKAKLHDHQDRMPGREGMQARNMVKWTAGQTALLQDIHDIKQQIERLVGERSGIPYKIPVSRMPPESRYTKLDQESKHLQNIVKMICHRAETAMASLLAPHYARSTDEIRAPVKSVI